MQGEFQEAYKIQSYWEDVSITAKKNLYEYYNYASYNRHKKF